VFQAVALQASVGFEAWRKNVYQRLACVGTGLCNQSTNICACGFGWSALFTSGAACAGNNRVEEPSSTMPTMHASFGSMMQMQAFCLDEK
jgi:hypothetical protein